MRRAAVRTTLSRRAPPPVRRRSPNSASRASCPRGGPGSRWPRAVQGSVVGRHPARLAALDQGGRPGQLLRLPRGGLGVAVGAAELGPGALGERRVTGLHGGVGVEARVALEEQQRAEVGAVAGRLFGVGGTPCRQKSRSPVSVGPPLRQVGPAEAESVPGVEGLAVLPEVEVVQVHDGEVAGVPRHLRPVVDGLQGLEVLVPGPAGPRLDARLPEDLLVDDERHGVGADGNPELLAVHPADLGDVRAEVIEAQIARPRLRLEVVGEFLACRTSGER